MENRTINFSMDDGYYTFLSMINSSKSRFERNVLRKSSRNAVDLTGIRDKKLREYLQKSEELDEKFIY